MEVRFEVGHRKWNFRDEKWWENGNLSEGRVGKCSFRSRDVKKE